jgi:hypothetical protein
MDDGRIVKAVRASLPYTAGESGDRPLTVSDPIRFAARHNGPWTPPPIGCYAAGGIDLVDAIARPLPGWEGGGAVWNEFESTSPRVVLIRM